MTYVWKVELFDLDLLQDEKRDDLFDMVVDQGNVLFSTEAKALAYAASVREEEQCDRYTGLPISWSEEHEAPNFCWHTAAPNEWEGILVRVTRVELDKE